MTSTVVSIRLPTETLQQLRVLAHQESLRRGKDISWSDLVREAVQKNLERDGDKQDDGRQVTAGSGNS